MLKQLISHQNDKNSGTVLHIQELLGNITIDYKYLHCKNFNLVCLYPMF